MKDGINQCGGAAGAQVLPLECEVVRAGVEVADHRADLVQAFDRLVGRVEHLAVLVAAQAAHDAQERRARRDAAVERARLDGVQQLRVDVKLLVQAVLGVLVVLGDRLEGVLLVEPLHHVDELLERVSLEVAARLGRAVPARDELLGRLGQERVTVDVVDRAAQRVPDLLRIGVLRVPDRVGGAALEVHARVGAEREVRVLVMEAPAVLGQVDAPERVDDAVRRAADGAVDGAGVREDLLPGSADPQAHLLARAGHETGVDHLAVVVDLGREHVLEVLPGIRREVGHHVEVLGEVARGQDDSLRGLVLDVLAVGVLSDDGAHAARVVVIADQVLGDGAVVDLAAEVLRECVGPRLGDERGALEHAHGGLVRPEVVLARRGVEHAVDVDVGHGQRALDALGLHLVDHPVHGLARLVLPHGPLAHVHHAAAGDLVDGRLDAALLGIVLDAVLGLVLRADGLERAAARQRLGAGGEHDDVRALLGGGDSAAQAGGTGAHDDDLVRLDLGDLVLGDGLGRHHERPGAVGERVAGQDGAGSRRSLGGDGGHGGGGGSACGDGARTGQEATAAHGSLHG